MTLSIPRPGDWLSLGDALIRVDRVALGEVLVAVFRGASEQPCAVVAVRLDEWAEATRGAAAVVLREDDPRQVATIIDGNCDLR